MVVFVERAVQAKRGTASTCGYIGRADSKKDAPAAQHWQQPGGKEHSVEVDRLLRSTMSPVMIGCRQAERVGVEQRDDGLLADIRSGCAPVAVTSA